jgi:hypothetical protein
VKTMVWPLVGTSITAQYRVQLGTTATLLSAYCCGGHDLRLHTKCQQEGVEYQGTANACLHNTCW